MKRTVISRPKFIGLYIAFDDDDDTIGYMCYNNDEYIFNKNWSRFKIENSVVLFTNYSHISLYEQNRLYDSWVFAKMRK